MLFQNYRTEERKSRNETESGMVHRVNQEMAFHHLLDRLGGPPRGHSELPLDSTSQSSVGGASLSDSFGLPPLSHLPSPGAWRRPKFSPPWARLKGKGNLEDPHEKAFNRNLDRHWNYPHLCGDHLPLSPRPLSFELVNRISGVMNSHFLFRTS